jgi:nitrite reductase/ring-hydroxylating ferredoxin subunit
MTMTRLIETSAVPDGEARAIKVAGIEPIAVFNIGGQFYATQDTCSHARASLAEGFIEGHEVSCPVHDGRFDVRDGKPLCFPVTEPIKAFATELREGAVWADLSTARSA